MRVALGQSKLESMVETAVSIAIGFVVAFSANLVILPLFGFYPDFWANFWLTVFFTVVSIIRSYFVRRLFNWLHLRKTTYRFMCLKCTGTITVIKGVYGATCSNCGPIKDRADFGKRL